MAKYACSIVGIQQLKNCASRILDGEQTIGQETNLMRQIADEYSGTLGPHQQDLVRALDEIAGAVKKSTEPAKDIATLLEEVAEAYQEVVDSKPFSSMGVGEGATSGSSGRNSSDNSNSGTEEKPKKADGSSEDKKTNNDDTISGRLKGLGVDFIPIKKAENPRSQEDIIKRISGGDLTQGSCSSLALTYAGNKAGYDVLDFRDGKSRDFFSSRDSITRIANLPDVKSVILEGTDDISSANQLMNNMIPGREYYFATGQHAAIIRKKDDKYEYLELQHPSNGNGWHNLDNDLLIKRFGCMNNHSVSYKNYLIEVDSLTKSRDFIGILGYINTNESEQRKGIRGNVK